jgi:CRISPR-associated exonuclease Cas4
MLPEYLPLSYLNQFIYCPRRFWLMYVQSEMEVNAPLLEGRMRHQRADQPGYQTDELGRTLRSVHVWSDTLRIAGVADFIEEREGATSLIPLEHKRGRMGRWLNDHVQLCAQAMCLEERTETSIRHGEIFYWANRRREQVVFDQALRDRTVETIQQIFALLGTDQMPPPIEHEAKCRDCSLEPICLPRETRLMVAE